MLCPAPLQAHRLQGEGGTACAAEYRELLTTKLSTAVDFTKVQSFLGHRDTYIIHCTMSCIPRAQLVEWEKAKARRKAVPTSMVGVAVRRRLRFWERPPKGRLNRKSVSAAEPG